MGGPSGAPTLTPDPGGGFLSVTRAGMLWPAGVAERYAANVTGPFCYFSLCEFGLVNIEGFDSFEDSNEIKIFVTGNGFNHLYLSFVYKGVFTTQKQPYRSWIIIL